ncbi:hypothetical protein CK623_03035 [Vandammella animalimorsus]|uniref:Transposase InsH N-terminal domain-containing protein n=1 Tax=Vandammella animalimorsus TaxID=2029117 RepID=A0A2A2AU21_9BURK|nr:hypothetical protein CK623_03035 [Vandammella animalimorsus]
MPALIQALVAWAQLMALIEPHYPKAGNGRPPIAPERMLRIHLLQHCFNLADAACEEALHDLAPLLLLCGHRPGRRARARCHHHPEVSPPAGVTPVGASHLCRGRPHPAAVRPAPERGHHRGRHHHCRAQLDQERGSPARARARDAPDQEKQAVALTHEAAHWHRPQDRPGAQCRGHLSANVHDKHSLPDLLRGAEKRVHGDLGYQSCTSSIQAKAPQARDLTQRRVRKPGGEDQTERWCGPHQEQDAGAG